MYLYKVHKHFYSIHYPKIRNMNMDEDNRFGESQEWKSYKEEEETMITMMMKRG